ncbi:MAG: UvrB/UvrC motif-containing protein [Gemmatales bacterium]|nr:UvrB/UvrC motif-containing protein [Gemmatales bacterium]MDW7994258.1 UvrB/UvrC motif-containing protein [Gemmatales bacterium]
MAKDIDEALAGWEFRPGVIQARLVDASDGRQVVQLRVDLGILQMELEGRPDGQRPHGFPTYLDYLRHQAAQARASGQEFRMTQEQCQEADREFMQYYHRRICWLTLRLYERAIADADHTLAFMDFVNRYAADEDYALAHEQYRGFVHFHRAQASAGLALERNDPETAIDELHRGIEHIRAFYEKHGLEDRIADDPMIRHLQQMQQQIRTMHQIRATLREQLAEAVAQEDYERAAQLRDAIRRRQRGE